MPSPTATEAPAGQRKRTAEINHALCRFLVIETSRKGLVDGGHAGIVRRAHAVEPAVTNGRPACFRVSYPELPPCPVRKSSTNRVETCCHDAILFAFPP